MNFENLIARLHILITFLMLTKFQENQKTIAISSNKCYNFKFLWSNVKNKLIDQIVNNIQFERNLICMLRT